MSLELNNCLVELVAANVVVVVLGATPGLVLYMRDVMLNNIIKIILLVCSRSIII